MVEYLIEPYYEHIRIANATPGKISTWLYDRLMSFPGTKFNKSDQTWIISKCYQHLVEIVMLTYLNKVSRREWLVKYRADTGVKEMTNNEERALLKEHFDPLSDEEWREYLLFTLPQESAWRRVIERERTK